MNGSFSRRAFMASTSALAVVASAGLTGPALAQAKTIAVRIDRDITSLDPAFRTGPHEANIFKSVYQRLIMQKAGSGDWELDAAADIKQVSPLLIEFSLKPGQMFTDGYGEMTADDVKFSFERFAINLGGGKESPYKGDWSGLTGVEVTGKYTGKIALSKANAGLFAIALADGSGCIVSKKAVTERGADYALKPVGSGPYQVASVEKQRGAVLKRNPAYAGAAKAQYDEVNVRFIQDPKTTELALRAGELDFAVLPPGVAEPLRGTAGLSVETYPGLAYIWLGMNTEKAPFTDIRVRQAIRLALDVDQMLVAGYNGKAPRLNALIPAPILGQWKDAPVYKRNVADAKALLAAAGQTNLKIKLTILSQPTFQTMALVAQAQLKEVGIDLQIDAQDGGTYWTAGKGDAGKNIDMFIMRFNGKLDPNFLMQWFTKSQIGNWNWQRFTSDIYDKLADDAIAELDPVKRAALVIQAQQEMDKSASIIWLTNDVAYVVRRATLKPSFLPGAIDWQLDRFAPAT
jgi:peptide/nickel transport system substrate-binding protein